jgi:hypothetical protein
MGKNRFGTQESMHIPFFTVVVPTGASLLAAGYAALKVIA